MRMLIVSALVALLALGACTSKQPSQTSIDYTQLVNPFIGTDFTGNTYPGAGSVRYGAVESGQWLGWLGPHLRLFLSGQYHCRFQSYTSLGYRCR